MRDLVSSQGERLVTLTGRGGSGKTSLALVAGDSLLADHPGGVWLASLAGVARRGDLLGAVARAISESNLDDEPLQAIRARLADRGPALLILDNLEHLLDRSGQVVALLDALPELRILATSQAPLRLAAERVLALDALDDEAALELIERVVSRRSRALSLGAEDRAALLDVVHLLDGLPLAVELAAARLALMRPAQLRDRLTASADLLREDRADRPERHRSLLSTVDWTLGLLDQAPRELFVRLGCFAAPAELETLEAVVDGDGVEVLDALPALLDVDLVRRVESGDGRIRFALPEALRQIASQRLDESGDGERWRRAHAHYVAEVAWAARLIAVPGPAYRAAVVAGPEVRAAIRWARATGDPQAERIAAAYATVLVDQGRVREALDLLEPVLAAPAADPEAHDQALFGHGYAMTCLMRLDEAASIFERLAELARDPSLLTVLAAWRATVALFAGDVAGGVPAQVRATEVARAHGDRAILACALTLEGQARLAAGELAAVRPLLDEAERVGRPVDAVYLDKRETTLGDLEFASGRPHEALELYARSLQIADAAGNGLQVLFDLRGTANALAAAGDDAAAVEAMGMVDAVVRELGGPGADMLAHLFGEDEVDLARQRLGAEAEQACLTRGRSTPATARVQRACELARATTAAAPG